MDVFYWEPFDLEHTFSDNVLVSAFESGVEQRRRKWSRQQRVYRISWPAMERSCLEPLIAFFQDKKGRLEPFYFKDPYDKRIENEALIWASQDVWKFTRKYIVPYSEVITRNGELLVRGTHYNVDYDSGYVYFILATEKTDTITGDYDYYRLVRFESDDLTRRMIISEVWSVETTLREVFA